MKIRRGDVIFWAGLGMWAALSAGLSFLGWIEEIPPGRGLDLATFLEISTRTLYFFFAEPIEGVPSENLLLMVARVMAPLATAGAILRVGIEFFADRIRAFRIRRMKGHTVVCGFSENGLAFAVSEAGLSRQVVVVGKDLDDATETIGRLHGLEILAGDPLDPAVINAAAVREAERLIVALPDDGKNLEIAMLARKIVEEQRTAGAPLLASVAVQNRQLWRQLARSDSIERSRERFEMLPFNLSVWAARQFVWDEPLWSYAALRGQARIHAVVVGFDDYAEAMIGYLPPSCVHPGLERPVFTILTHNDKTARDRIMQAYPNADQIADIHIRRFDHETDSLDEGFMSEVSGDGEVTAIFICLDRGDAALSMAIYVQDAMRRTGHWRSPVYLRLSKCEGINDLLVDSSRARRFVDIIQPFGVEDRLCTLEILEGRLEGIAQDIHLAYQGTRQSRLGHEGEGRSGAALSEWRNLPETYRVSNRRAADHIGAKLSSAGCRVPKGHTLEVPKDFRLCEAPEAQELLAEFEHRSWVAGRLVDGWLYGERRDDVRRLHPNIIAYEQLDEPTKDFDRDQVRLLDRELLTRVGDGKGKNLVRHDHWIGMVGKNRIDPGDGAWLREQIAGNVLPKLLKREPEAHLTLVTPLAPGSDFVMTEAAIAYLRDRDIPHRLLIIEAVPEGRMIDDFKESFNSGAVWNGEPRADGETWEQGGEDAGPAPELISEARQKIISGSSTEWVIDLTDPSVDYHDSGVRKHGYQKAADYILQRSRTLIAAHRPSLEEGETKAGGTVETLKHRTEFVRDNPDKGFTGIVLDLDGRRVEEQRT